jgi:hypothetical protein
MPVLIKTLVFLTKTLEVLNINQILCLYGLNTEYVVCSIHRVFYIVAKQYLL